METAEQFADEYATASQFQVIATATGAGLRALTCKKDDPDAQAATVAAMVDSATNPNVQLAASGVTAYSVPLGGYRGTRDEAYALMCDVLRDIFGNPFQPIAFSPEWRTDTAVVIARTMYESREFSAMPILADALQDAGCDNPDILNHCRDAKQVHVRGCWVVDRVLDKE